MQKDLHAPMRRLGGGALAGLALAGTLVLFGCGSGGGAGENGGGSATEVQVEKSFWHRGFKVTLGGAKVMSGESADGTPSDALPAVTIEATFQNLGNDALEFPSEMVLSSAGEHYTEAAAQQELPKVPGQASERGTIAFVVGAGFQLGEAVLTVGASDERQAVVPLSRSEGLISLEPRSFAVSGRAHSGPNFYSTVQQGEVRADNPRWHTQAEADHEYVWLHFTVTNDSGGMLAVLYGLSNRLKLPDGSSVSVDVTCGRPQLHPGPHSTADGGLACFHVPSPVGGEYLYAISDDDAEGLEFTIA
jgi:hypothetical protein